MRHISTIAYSIALATVLTACADYVDTSDYKVNKPEEISAYEYLKDYETLNNYVDRSGSPQYKLGLAVNGTEFSNRSGLYVLACSNFDIVTATSEMSHNACVDNSGLYNLVAANNFAKYAKENNLQVMGHAIMSTNNQNVTWLNSIVTTAQSMLGADQMIVDQHDDYTQLTSYPYSLVGTITPKVENGVLVANITAKKHQFYILENVPTEPGQTYILTIKYKGNKDTNLTMQINDKNNTFKFPIFADWYELKTEIKAPSTSMSLIVDPGNIKVNLEIESVDLRHQRGLTSEETYELYYNELDRWTDCIIAAGEGAISDWEIINCPLANSGDNGDGYYPLMNKATTPNGFYWWDYLGETGFMKIGSDLVSKYFAENGGNAADLKLYVNEDCVDDVHKAESLLYWIKKWESAGAKIDGIGTEMHLTLADDAASQEQLKAAVTTNLKTLASSGKLLRISALEVSLKDETGAIVSAANMTVAQQKAVSDFYKWVFKTYADNVPAAQQSGICLWSPIDNGNIAGLWNATLDRTPAYAGVADALQGK